MRKNTAKSNKKKDKKKKMSDSLTKFLDKIHKAPWQCPNYECGKKHSKLHYAFPDQVDHKKMVMEPGRVKYNREEGKGDDQCEMFKGDTDINKMDTNDKGVTGPATDKDGNPSPLFCPHCGWEEELVIIVKTK